MTKLGTQAHYVLRHTVTVTVTTITLAVMRDWHSGWNHQLETDTQSDSRCSLSGTVSKPEVPPSPSTGASLSLRLED